MDIRQLRYFVQIVESGSLLQASRQIFIAQPALSQQLAKLESEVGVKLLTRSARGVVPTEHGHALYHHAKFLIRQVDQSVLIARQGRAAIAGLVSIGLAPTTVAAIGLELVRHLRHKYPAIMLNVVESLSGHLEQMLEVGRLDMAVLFKQLVLPRHAAQPLIDETLVIVVPAASKLVPARRRSLTLAETCRLPLILPTASHGLRRRIDIEIEQQNLRLNMVAEVDSLALLMASVREGFGATIQPMSATLVGARSPKDWRVLHISDASLTRKNYLYTLGEDKLSPAAVVVRDELLQLVRVLVDSGKWPGARADVGLPFRV
jgi:LysR family tcuABC transcriptional regulator